MIAFVEGTMERQFINQNFKYVHVVSISNGVTWTVEQICRQISTLYQALDVEGEIVVWLDRERRNETAQDIRSSILTEMLTLGLSENSIHILVNDLMTENIILSDEHIIRNEFGATDYQYAHEGSGGKVILKGLYKNLGVSYKETVHGVSLLKKIRLENCAMKSASVASFLATFSRDCWWLQARS